MEFTVNQVAEMLGGEVRGNGNEKINMLGKIQDAKKGQISFLSNPKYEQYIYTTQATAVIVKKDFVARKEVPSILILVDDPYSSFTRLLEEYHKLISFQKTGVEQPSFMAENSTIGKSFYRGAFSYIGSNVTIGDNVKIYPHAYIGDNVTIGNNTIIHSGVKIYADTRIGDHCVIHSGTVIGSDGFGFAPQEDGSYKTIPQLGSVVIEDNVAIGGNTVIDCATLFGDATIIRKGVKLDNLIQIAHNVEVGQNTVIAAQTGIYQFENRISILPAIVDTDTFDHEILFIGQIDCSKAQDFRIEAGTPLVTIFPFKRDRWQMTVEKNLWERSKTKLAVYENMFFENIYRRFFHSKKAYK